MLWNVFIDCHCALEGDFFMLLFFSLQNQLVPSLICFYVTLLHAFHLHIIRSCWCHSILCECVLSEFIQMAKNFFYPCSKLKFLRLIIYHRSSSLIVVISVQTFYDLDALAVIKVVKGVRVTLIQPKINASIWHTAAGRYKSWEFSGKLIINWLLVATVGCTIINTKKKFHIHNLCTEICNRSMRSRPTDSLSKSLDRRLSFRQSSREQFYFDLEWGNRIQYCTNWRNFYPE